MQTVDMKRRLKKQFRRKNAVGNMMVRDRVLICTFGGKNPIVQVILLPNLWMCSSASIIPTLLENLLSVIVPHSNVLLTSPDTHLTLNMNATDHINVAFRKSAYSLMSRVTTSLSSIATAIVNSDEYLWSPLINKW